MLMYLFLITIFYFLQASPSPELPECTLEVFDSPFTESSPETDSDVTVGATLVSWGATNDKNTLPVAGCSRKRKQLEGKDGRQEIPATDNESTQDTASTSTSPLATPSSHKKKKTEDSEQDPLTMTVTNYFNAKLQKKSQRSQSDTEDAYARHMSNAIYEMLKALPRREQLLVSNEIFNIVLKYQQ